MKKFFIFCTNLFLSIISLQVIAVPPPVDEVNICNEDIKLIWTPKPVYGTDAFISQALTFKNCKSGLVPQTISYNYYNCETEKYDTASAYGRVGTHCASLANVIQWFENTCRCK